MNEALRVKRAESVFLALVVVVIMLILLLWGATVMLVGSVILL